MANSKELRFVEKAAAKDETFDVLLVVGKDLQREKILQQCRDLGLDDSKIVFDFEACMPGFSLERSNRLHRSRTSVFSINSWGRKICERFQLPFLSPFVDSTMTTEDYLSFLEAPREHLARELVFKETLGTADGREFPVFSMGKEGPKVYMLYETDAAKAGQQWKERVQRINWQDLLLVMYTESPDVLDRFDRLPYGKKVCFTSFESRLGSAFYLPAEQDEEGRICRFGHRSRNWRRRRSPITICGTCCCMAGGRWFAIREKKDSHVLMTVIFRRLVSILVMPPAGDQVEDVFLDIINESVFVVYAAAPHRTPL